MCNRTVHALLSSNLFPVIVYHCKIYQLQLKNVPRKMENQKIKNPLSATLKKLFAVFLAVKNMLQKLSLILQPILNHSKLNQVNHLMNSFPTSWPQCQGKNLRSLLAPKMFRFWNSLFIKTFLWRPVLKRVRLLKPFFVEVTEISNKIAPHNKKTSS